MFPRENSGFFGIPVLSFGFTFLRITPIRGGANRLAAEAHLRTHRGGYVSATGRWRLTSGQLYLVPILPINTVEISCWKDLMKCDEVMAIIYTPDKAVHGNIASALPHKELYVAQAHFRVIEWTASRIVARRETPPADIEIHILLKDNIAERHHRETKARGSTSADPKVRWAWVLE